MNWNWIATQGVRARLKLAWARCCTLAEAWLAKLRLKAHYTERKPSP